MTGFGRCFVAARSAVGSRVLLPAIGLLLLIILAACESDEGVTISDSDRGSDIYARECQSCHGDAATGIGALPDAPVHGPEGHTWHHADGQLSEIILGRLSYAGRTMPSFEGKLKDTEIADIIAHMKLGWESSQIEFQEKVSDNWRELQKSRE